MSKLIDQGLAALAQFATTAPADEESAAKKLKDFLANRKAATIRDRAKIVEADWMNLSLTIDDPAEVAILKRLTNMSAEEAAADDGTAVQLLDAAEAAIKAKRDALKPKIPGPSNGGEGRAEELAAKQLPVIFFDEARNAPVQRYHIKGFIAEGATSSVFAHPKKMKSTIVTDAGVHLAAGKEDWRGHRIREAKGVVYFAFERHIQVRQALTAYAIRDGLENIPFAIVPRLINVLDPGCVEIIKNAIDRVQQRYGIEVALSVFDTWNKGIAAGGGSEDKAEHQNAAAANLRRLIEQLPALHCLTVGHAGKDVSKGERGSNATEGDRDVGFEIKSDGGKHALEVAYANALPEGEVMTTFEGELIEIGKNEDGEPVNSFIVSRLPVAMHTAKVNQTLKEPEQLVLDALRGVLKSKGQTGHAIGGRSVMRSEWLDECLRLGTVGQNPWRDIERRQQKLLAAGRIFVLDDRVRLTSDAGSGAQSIPTPTLPSNGIPLPPGYKGQ
jgi:hypothetical protein